MKIDTYIPIVEHLNDLVKEILSFSLVLQIFSLTEKENNLSTNILALKYHEVQP